jgi:hypothetical protein
MATAHSKTQRAKGNADTIVIDSSFWDSFQVRVVYQPKELEAKGYRNSEFLAKKFNVTNGHVAPPAKRAGLESELFDTDLNGTVRRMRWWFKPKGS